MDARPAEPTAAVRPEPATALAEGLSAALRRVLTPGTAANRLLRFGIAMMALAMELVMFRTAWLVTFHGVDLEIPLRAAQRWVDGGQPYLASSFGVGPGPDLPFLYPPFVLPMVAPLLALPRELVIYGWMAVCVAASAAACWRLNVPARWWIVLLLWPPFTEGIITGNIQIVLFLCFTLLFFRPDRSAPAFRPTARDPLDPAMPAVREGFLASVIAAFKVAELHAWVYLLFRRPRAAILGAGIIALVALATLPIVGLPLWGDWFAQVRRAADPTWTMAGVSISRYVGQVGGVVLFGLSVAALWFVPRANAGRWVGLLAVLGAPSLHTYGLLFMLPAMLVVRRELALIAAFFVATYTEAGVWLAIMIVALGALGSTRWPWLAEPRGPAPRSAPVVAAGLP